VSRHEPPGVDRVHTEYLDDAVYGRVGVRVQLDEGVGAVGGKVDLSGRRERSGTDEGEGLVAGDRFVRVDVGQVQDVTFRPVQVRDDVRVEIEPADLVDGRPYEHVGAAGAAQRVLAVAAVDDVVAGVADDAIVVDAAGQG
jgi:hypothetical protein